MLVVCVGDGLGNQMFQYAFYLELQYKYPGNKITMDICNFYGSMNNHNGYELERIFGIKANICPKHEALMLADYYPRQNKLISKCYYWRKIVFGQKDCFITVDDPTYFYESVFKLNPLKSYMFRGNWINENYFTDVREQLFMDFHFPPIIDKQNQQLLHEIEMNESVSIHVRRGDYLNTGMCKPGIEYYKHALNEIYKRIGKKIKCFIFSDDTEYVKREFKFLDNYVLIDNNRGGSSYRDMQLMTYCKHNIIANSTFSFWGAYLNRYSNKVVVAPKKAAPEYMNSFACSDWILLD